jgi:hypothetical protein
LRPTIAVEPPIEHAMQPTTAALSARHRLAPWRLVPCCCCVCPPLSEAPRIRRVGRIVRRARRRGLLSPPRRA